MTRGRNGMHKEDEFVLCPFYKKDTPQAIHCEGIERNTALNLGFSQRDQRCAYKNRYCRGDWSGCRLAQMLWRKYE